MDKLTPLIQKYFPKDQWANAMKIAQAESTYGKYLEHKNPDGSTDIGPFQINSIHAAQIKKVFGYDFNDLKDDFEKNVQVAKWIYDTNKGWSPWSTAKGLGIDGYTQSPTNTGALPTPPVTSGVMNGTSIPNPMNIPKQYDPNDPRYLPTGPLNPKSPGRIQFEKDYANYQKNPDKPKTIMDVIKLLLSQGAPTNQLAAKPNTGTQPIVPPTTTPTMPANYI